MAALDRYDEWADALDRLLGSADTDDPLVDVYDPQTLAAIDEGETRPHASRWRGRAAAGAVVAGLVTGIRDVFEPEGEPVVELQESTRRQPEAVTVHLAWGNPAASVAVVRRWLL
jgi:hypothetical protein